MHCSKMKLVEKYSDAIDAGNAAIFAGAGLSIGAGYVDWVNLLSEPAKEIRLDSKKEKHDLVTLAQFYINESGNNRGTLNEIINSNFGFQNEPTENHKILAKLPISTYWSTNYDCLIEKALEANGKVCDVKHDDKQLKISQPNRDAVIYKMHGDVRQIDGAIISRDDYQAYERERPLTREVLEGDLITKTFLFIGFSFEDPNINHVLGRIRILVSENTRPHYCFLRRVNINDCTGQDDFIYKTRRQELQIHDLGRHGIQVCLIDQYDEITDVLKLIYNRYRRRTIFISGSAATYNPFPTTSAQYFLHNLTSRLIRRKHNYRIISGYGYGIGEYILNAVIKECSSELKRKVADCITLLPIPYKESKTDTKDNTLVKEYRKELIKSSGLSLFLFGNKVDGDRIVPADGMKEEYDLSSWYHSIQLPIPCTGHVAEELYYLAKNNKDIIEYEPNYMQALELCGFSLDGIYSQSQIEKMVTSILRAIDLMNSFDDSIDEGL